MGNLWLGIAEKLGFLEGVRKAVDGKKTYTTSVMVMLIATGFMALAVYLWSEKKIGTDELLTMATVCSGFIVNAFKSMFQRAATSKVDSAVRQTGDQVAAVSQDMAAVKELLASLSEALKKSGEGGK
jgi:hypothetical protein